MKTLPATKFVMACLSCLLLDDYGPIRRYKGYSVIVRTESEGRKVEEVCRRLGMPLVHQHSLRLPE